MSDQFPLTPCTPLDIPSMALVYNAAFSGDNITNIAMPPTVDPAAKKIWLHKRLTDAFSKPGIQHWKITDSETGDIVAWCRWEIPVPLGDRGEKLTAEKEINKDMLPPGACVPFWERMFTEILKLRSIHLENNMHLCHFLITHPSYQKRGLGSKLMRHGCILADQAAQRVYIEATKAGWPVYRKFGFGDLVGVRYDLGEFGGVGWEEHWVMVRGVGGREGVD